MRKYVEWKRVNAEWEGDTEKIENEREKMRKCRIKERNWENVESKREIEKL